MTGEPDNSAWNRMVIWRGLIGAVFMLAAAATFFGINGCATRFDTRTWVSDEPGDPVKHTRVTHSMAFGIPALFPMDATFTDGEFQVETKAVNIPTVDIGTLFERDE